MISIGAMLLGLVAPTITMLMVEIVIMRKLQRAPYDWQMGPKMDESYPQRDRISGFLDEYLERCATQDVDPDTDDMADQIMGLLGLED